MQTTGLSLASCNVIKKVKLAQFAYLTIKHIIWTILGNSKILELLFYGENDIITVGGAYNIKKSMCPDTATCRNSDNHQHYVL